MKVRSALKRMCAHCYFVRRRKKLYVMCKRHPKHKQRQGFATAAYPLAASSEPLSPLALPPSMFFRSLFLPSTAAVLPPLPLSALLPVRMGDLAKTR